MNQTIKTILNHRSIRKFKNVQLTDNQIQTIVKAAQSASTSSFIQAYSIIGISDQRKKEKLATIAGNQSYVIQNGHFFVFCADLFRHELIAKSTQRNILESLESTEKFMVALIDTALAAQNATIAAESMGFGICFIGGIRNNLQEAQQILEIPQRVIPLFGLAVGVPDQTPEPKPRLPFSHVYHENHYRTNLQEFKEQLEEYDEIIQRYYEKRTNGNRKDQWTEQITQMLEKKQRMYMKEFVQEKGFSLK